MTAGLLRSYSLGVIRTCHKRGVHAMGGMAAQIPIKNDPKANQAAVDKASQSFDLSVIYKGLYDSLKSIHTIDTFCRQELTVVCEK